MKIRQIMKFLAHFAEIYWMKPSMELTVRIDYRINK